jgi:RNA polymerase sigma-70 factor (ECF subfamily)
MTMIDPGLMMPDSEAHSRPKEPGAPSGEARLRALVDAHHEFVWRSLRRLGVPEREVDDGVQKTFLVVSNKLAAISAGSERSFLFQTALRIAADSRRTQRRRREVIGDEYGEPEDPAPRADDLVDLRRARARLDAILSGMSLELRAVFLLFELEQMTLSEIADLLTLPRGTVASRLRRARAEFYEKVAKHPETGNHGAGT